VGTIEVFMNCLPSLFAPFAEKIGLFYGKACADAGVDPAAIQLALEELSFNKRAYESEFAAIPDPPQVRITWNGVASLWAFGQGAARIARAMFEAQRAADPKDPPPALPIEGELETGVHLFELSIRLARHRFDHWVDWAPKPDALAETIPDAEGNQLFFGALGWIMRHELAHHVLKHHARRSGIPDDNKAQEFEADDHATRWMKGNHAADPERPFGVRPSPDELDLERRALVMFVGMIWVAQFELGPHGESATHPDAALRLHAVADRLALSPDSFAAEILSYIVKVLIDPDGHWPAETEQAYAADAAIDALIRLNRHISAQKG